MCGYCQISQKVKDGGGFREGQAGRGVVVDPVGEIAGGGKFVVRRPQVWPKEKHHFFQIPVLNIMYDLTERWIGNCQKIFHHI